ncbi:hypothetical protein BRARA_J01040 [Brassica rapa]|uniref:25S rRNA (uridine-N(3))-methyltransferase BMT5-like domain-containing protein n=1 Tax=Brassica campestris TaxID=3711 RepID=A0A397XJN1_BRACM|nr:hypothetical protein BRARA_J01040 [Brassica rapa]
MPSISFTGDLNIGRSREKMNLARAKATSLATNITVTSLDTREEIERKYKDAENNVEELERRGCTVVHGFKVHSMDTEHRESI